MVDLRTISFLTSGAVVPVTCVGEMVREILTRRGFDELLAGFVEIFFDTVVTVDGLSLRLMR